MGEYLLTLPQQLESLSAGSGQDNREGDEADDVAFFASSWLTKVNTPSYTIDWSFLFIVMLAFPKTVVC